MATSPDAVRRPPLWTVGLFTEGEEPVDLGTFSKETALALFARLNRSSPRGTTPFVRAERLPR